MYLQSIAQEGFLETARTVQVVAMQERRKQQRVLIFEEQTAWMTQHGNIDDFVTFNMYQFIICIT